MEPLEGATTVERMLLAQAKSMRTPANGSIELLPLCNMNCDMCYVRLSREEMERQGRLRTADEWLEIGRQMKDAGVLFLLLTGGEPFLFPEFRRLYLGLREMGMILTINTNGTLIDEDLAEFFGKHKPRRINITLYGTDEETYADLCHYPGGYEKTLRGIRLLREHGVDVRVGGSIVRANKDDLDKLLDIEEEYGVPVRVDTYMMPAVRERELPYNMQSRLEPEEAARARVYAWKREMGPELFPQYVRQLIERADHPEPKEEKPGHMACMAGQCSFTINWQGEMRPCVILSSPAVSVFDAGFGAAWRHIVEETGKILLNAKCSACHLRHLCRTCAASALYETGSYDGVPDYMCRYAEESLRTLREEWKQIEESTQGKIQESIQDTMQENIQGKVRDGQDISDR